MFHVVDPTLMNFMLFTTLDTIGTLPLLLSCIWHRQFCDFYFRFFPFTSPFTSLPLILSISFS